jgi:transglutaminase-like putative cysteine protease
VYWFYPAKSSGGTVNKCIVYNYRTNKWGRSDIEVSCVAEYIEPGITYDSLGTSYSTYDSLPTTISYDSSFWTAETASIAFFKTDNKIYTFTGIPMTSSITTGHYGDISQFATITRVRPRFLKTPTSSTLEYSHSNTNADEMTQNITSTLTNNVYDLLWAARWHKFKFNYNGEMKTTGFSPEFTGVTGE